MSIKLLLISSYLLCTSVILGSPIVRYGTSYCAQREPNEPIITLLAGEMTDAQVDGYNFPQRPQLTCVGSELCQLGSIERATCVAVNKANNSISWKCVADTPPNLKLEAIRIYCQTSYQDDNIIYYADTCSLDYRLTYFSPVPSPASLDSIILYKDRLMCSGNGDICKKHAPSSMTCLRVDSGNYQPRWKCAASVPDHYSLIIKHMYTCTDCADERPTFVDYRLHNNISKTSIILEYVFVICAAIICIVIAIYMVIIIGKFILSLTYNRSYFANCNICMRLSYLLPCICPHYAPAEVIGSSTDNDSSNDDLSDIEVA